MIVSLCDYTGIMVRPWARAGYYCLCVDLEPANEDEYYPSGGRIHYQRGDVLAFEMPKDTLMALSAPPCTDLSSSGARWFKEKGLRRLIASLELVEACRSLSEGAKCPWALENPVGVLSTYWRKPDLLFDPRDYGGYLTDSMLQVEAGYTKKTCLWVGGGFILPPKRPVANILGSVMARHTPSADRGRIRSMAPRGFAEAVFAVNRMWVRGEKVG